MAWNKNDNKGTASGNTRPKVQDWLLFVFDQHEVKDAQTGEVKFIKFNAKLSSKPAEGQKYGQGLTLTVMARVSGDRQTDINPDDYTHKWILVTGGIQLEDRKNDAGTWTNITVWADSVKIAPKK